MQPEKVFKRYDVRGKYPEELDEEFFELIGKSLAAFVLENYGEKIVVCRDNKESSEGLKKNLVEGLTSSGVDVVDAGVGPTDYAAFHGSKRDLVSVQVTSSHMPLDFNGLKFMYPEGNGFVNKDLNELKRIFREREFREGKGKVEEVEKPEKDYIQAMKDFLEDFVETTDRKLVVDTLGGATTDFLPRILEEVGFKVVNIAGDRERPYYDPPNPKPEILEDMPDQVGENNADMGLATDMDGDRVAVYYEGEWLSGDDLFFIFSQVISGDVVASIDSSDILEEFAEEVYYTRVGDPFVIDETLKRNAELSGEPNGHYCFPGFVAYNSGTLAAALIASTDVNPRIENIPGMHLEKINVDVKEKEEAMERVEEKVKSRFNVLSDKDGVKFSSGEASALIRPSGSSPVIRIKAESEDKKEAKEIAEEAEEVIRESI
jgi:phosphomannomutase